MFDRPEFVKSDEFERIAGLRIGDEIERKREGGGTDDYHDPVGELKLGDDYRRQWLAGWQPVTIDGRPTGLYMLVQQSYETVLGRTLTELRQGFIRVSVVALTITATR
ncbi:MAG: hypothetical protein QM811_02325 [Pirellulales bacterium]